MSLSVFNKWLSFSSNQRNYETLGSTQGNVIKHFYKTNRYVKYSVTVSADNLWNKIHKQLKNMLYKDLSANKVKAVVSKFHLKSFLLIMQLY